MKFGTRSATKWVPNSFIKLTVCSHHLSTKCGSHNNLLGYKFHCSIHNILTKCLNYSLIWQQTKLMNVTNYRTLTLCWVDTAKMCQPYIWLSNTKNIRNYFLDYKCICILYSCLYLTKYFLYLLDRFAPDFRHDGRLPSKVLIAQAEEVVDYKCCNKQDKTLVVYIFIKNFFL